MAGNQYSDQVLDGVNYLKDKSNKEVFSFVFKTEDVQLNGKDIKWNNYKKELPNDELKSLIRGAEGTWDNTEDMEWESEVDALTKRQVFVFDALVKKCLFEVLNTKNIPPTDVIWFIQHEWGRDQGWHCHVLIGGKDFSQAQGKWWRRQLNVYWSRWLITACNIGLSPAERIKLREIAEDSEWVTLLTYKHRHTKKDYTKMVCFGNMIAYYFMTKKRVCSSPPREGGYFLCSDSAWKMNFLKEGERHLVSKLYTDEMKPETVETTVTTAQEAKRGRIQTRKEVSIKTTLKELVQKRVTSPEDWMMLQPDSYIEMMAQPGGENLLKNTLEICTLTLARTKSAFDLILEKAETRKLQSFVLGSTRTCKIFELHGWNYIKVCHAICCVLNRQGGKRNTILFHGPASTGKSIIAQAIAQAVGNVGCYNAANVNFPFNDCTNKNLIWVEEAGNFGQQVNQFKAICSGQTIRIDQKGKGSKQIEPTPVIMTTNENVTVVRIGCEERPEHTQPIRDRMLNLNLTRTLPGNFGLIDNSEWPLICAWLVKNGYKSTMADYCTKWEHVPEWTENWAEPAMQTAINSAGSSNCTSPATRSTPQSQNYALTPLASDLEDLALKPWSTPNTPAAGTAETQNTGEAGSKACQDGQLSPTWSEIEEDLRACFSADPLKEDFSELPNLD
uniref:Initiator protein NS1 n=1 Tax=Protoparvovirus rodent3 TaxID=3052719 RepID=A0A2Z3D6X1_9VIRU|nr:nonstructural protein 1 [Protoparvovirus rodent3]